MRKTLALAAVAVLAFTGSAFADLVAATNVQDTLTGSGTFTDNAVPNTAAAGTINGVFAFDKSLTGVGAVPGTLVVDVTYPVNGSKGETTVFIFTGTGTTGGGVITVSSVAFYTAAGGFGQRATTSSFVGSNAIAAGANILRPTGFALVGGYAGVQSYDTVRITFNFTAVGNRLNVDMVSNPEPGTIALFAFGAAGLGGFAWRRRKAQLVAKA